ncbi:hypothetical protein QE400_003305 [Xanthomonas sacchari]|nr:hypothetical protein [Xanthomonas sacchari]
MGVRLGLPAMRQRQSPSYFSQPTSFSESPGFSA